MDTLASEKTLTGERIFTSSDLPCLSLPNTDGLVTCRWFQDSIPGRPAWRAPGGTSRPAWAEATADDDGGLGQRGPGQVSFVVVDRAWLVREGMDRVRTRAVDAVVLHAKASPPGRTALALAFSAYLRIRQHRMGLGADVVTAAVRPELAGAPGIFRVPHLVTVSDGTGTVADTIIWQVMSGPRYDAWLGGATRPDHVAIEAALPSLLRLRHQWRTGRLDQARADTLSAVLDGGDLTAQKIFRHPRVVLPLANRALRGSF
ncbi:hypothetical protein I6A84_01910 [Frankia sp. CNm7]|uniref:Uncharacterized protein n=1 Tax=Frankia nepalensis TaxID=1836974 RepID=A0A937RC91_9ACTN|nr:hypothetical protein [Frankia nepalensis]MBL7497732.1 hypothetical protein [Frankia nepalensis]MBL7509739.1 hypothetical protein [Frankia nepalensis]MBL7516913.1 hypothetical protein [Frankia nepalensis]MBL7629466.1 hypothetical protein [Frankia nepalensis]